MTGTGDRNRGLEHGKRWDVLPSGEGPIGWSFDATRGLVQGPLDLESFQGQSMMLSLETGQTALLIQDGKLRAIYLDGIHNLMVGHGFNQIAPTSSLVFISTATPLQLRWKKDSPVQWNEAGENSIIGHCDMAITDPVLFYENYLRHNDTIAEEYALAELDATVRAALADMIGTGPLGGEPTTMAELQSRLTCTSAQTLTEDLAAQGVTCTQLSLYAVNPTVELDPSTRVRFAPVHY